MSTSKSTTISHFSKPTSASKKKLSVVSQEADSFTVVQRTKGHGSAMFFSENEQGTHFDALRGEQLAERSEQEARSFQAEEAARLARFAENDGHRVPSGVVCSMRLGRVEPLY